ncbi:MAG: hypothetical protein KY432_11340, partial [Acidobacteria bacterium]|nr:hypothetical protein [Acidobacteriota bacterium]
ELPELFAPAVAQAGGNEVPSLQLLIDGDWRPAAGGETFEVQSSIDGSVITSAAKASAEDVEVAIAAARRSRASFRSLPAAARLDPSERFVSWLDGQRLHFAPVDAEAVPLMTLEHDDVLVDQTFAPDGKSLAVSTERGLHIWSITGRPPTLLARRDAGEGTKAVRFDRTGKRVAISRGLVWELGFPSVYDPLRLRGVVDGWGVDFHPRGRWIATGDQGGTRLWPSSRRYPLVIRGHEGRISGLAITAAGLIATSADGTVRRWPMPDGVEMRDQILLRKEGTFSWPRGVVQDPHDRYVVVGNPVGEVTLIPLDGGAPRELGSFSEDVTADIAVDASGRRIVASSGNYQRNQAIARVWDLETGEVKVLDARDGEFVRKVEFTPTGAVRTFSRGGMVRQWDLASSTYHVIRKDFDGRVLASHPDGEQLLVEVNGTLHVERLPDGPRVPRPLHGEAVARAIFDRSGRRIISADGEGVIRVGYVEGCEPHLLLGHEGAVTALAVSRDGRWIASGGEDRTIRLWPMPDLSKPPLHRLSHKELMARLEALTNLRAVRDAESETGWKIDVAPFRGWKEVPQW